MRNKPRTLVGPAFTIGAVAACMILAGSARADTFDTTLASPDTNAATGNPNTGAGSGTNPSWYNGSGNPQGGWTVGLDNGIEVGLRAKLRGVDGVIDTPNDDYLVPAGAGSNPALALWNYEFSIDLRPGGVGILSVADIAANTVLTVTDLNTLATGSVNPLTHWTDDTGFGSGAGGASGSTSTGKHIPDTSTDWGVQNSQNLGFGDSPLAGFFNPNSGDTYQFELLVKDAGGATLASTDMEVTASPEPSAVILMSVLILPLFFLARRRKSKSV